MPLNSMCKSTLESIRRVQKRNRAEKTQQKQAFSLPVCKGSKSYLLQRTHFNKPFLGTGGFPKLFFCDHLPRGCGCWHLRTKIEKCYSKPGLGNITLYFICLLSILCTVSQSFISCAKCLPLNPRCHMLSLHKPNLITGTAVFFLKQSMIVVLFISH